MKKRRNGTPQKYKAPAWAERYVALSLDWEIKPTISARCEILGIERSTFYRALRKPEFVAWLQHQSTNAIAGEKREIRLALLRKCLTGDIEAIRLWHELYEQYIPATRPTQPGTGENLENADDARLADIAVRFASGAGPKVH